MSVERPNILFIMADQLAAPALSCYGNPTVQSPHLDRLAQQGVTFVNNYCNCPICAPSRASMYSGRLAARLQNFDNGTLFPADIPTFLHHLRHAGYEVLSSGKQHFVGPDQLHGYERRLTTDIYPSAFKWTKNWSAPIPSNIGMVSWLKKAGPVPWTKQLDYDEEVHFHALEQLRAYGEQKRQRKFARPFFLCVSYTHPHDPPLITEEWWNLYEGIEIDMPRQAPDPSAPIPASDRWLIEYLGLDRITLTEDDVRRSRRGYYAMTSYLDARVGELLKTLERHDLAEDTIVLFTADHGDMVGEHGLWFKRSYYEWSARVPLIISWPGHYPEGRRVTQATSLVDLYPTILDMVGLEKQPWESLDGQSLFALIQGDDSQWKDLAQNLGQDGGAEVSGRTAIVDFTSAGAIHPWRAVRQGRYKYVAVHTEEPLLFDLEADPGEWHNLAGQAELSAVEAKLAARAHDGWDPVAIEAREIVAQQERLFIQGAMGKGIPTHWDYQPFFDATQQYTR
ncbi:MAG: choline-sulfatase [Chloroflexi bacterium]|nr:choline-sulfatase [Chloroflexota bacterium]